MHVRVPFPVWAMNGEEALPSAAPGGAGGAATADDLDVFGDVH